MFGTKKQKKLYLLVRPEEIQVKEKKYKSLKLPEGYVKISECNLIYPPYREGLNYIKSRGITDDMVKKFMPAMKLASKKITELLHI